MCALLGLDFARPICAGFSFHEFSQFSDDNADGWGLAWYPDQSAALIKEPVGWRASPHSAFLHSYQQMHSRIHIAHVRHRTSGGEPTHADTHPFLRELGGRDYCFAHNGTLAKERLTVERFLPLGSTDSELLFCHLLGELAQAHLHPLDSEPGWRWLHKKLLALNQLGKLNCLLTDGYRLFCYRDHGNWKGLAFCRVYLHGQETHHFEDPSVKVDLEGEFLNHGIMVATQPLSGEGWLLLDPGELLVLENGRTRFSTHRDLSKPESAVPTDATPALAQP